MSIRTIRNLVEHGGYLYMPSTADTNLKEFIVEHLNLPDVPTCLFEPPCPADLYKQQLNVYIPFVVSGNGERIRLVWIRDLGVKMQKYLADNYYYNTDYWF
jgi:hypothetical protein